MEPINKKTLPSYSHFDAGCHKCVEETFYRRMYVHSTEQEITLYWCIPIQLRLKRIPLALSPTISFQNSNSGIAFDRTSKSDSALILLKSYV